MSLISRFQRKSPVETIPAAPVTGEIGGALTSLIAPGFERYNPSALVGRKGPGILRTMMDDDQIGPCLMFLQYATVAQGFTWKLDKDSDEAKTQEEFTAWADAMMESYYRGLFLDLLLNQQSAHAFGFAVIELIYNTWEWEGRTTWALQSSKLRPFETFTFKADKHGNTETLIQTVWGQPPLEIELSGPMGTKFLHFINRPDEDPQYGKSDLAACYRDWWAKDVIIRFWNIYQQCMAGGFKVLEVKGTIDPTARAEIVAILQTLQTETGIYYSSDRFHLRVELPPHTISFEKAVEAKNRALARTLLMPSLLGFSDDTTVGSLARSQTHRGSLDFILNIRSKRICDHLNEHLWRPLAWWNFGLKEPPIWEPMPITDEMRAERAAAWGDLVQKGAAKADLETENKIREWFDLPARAEDEESPLVPQPGGASPLTVPASGGLPAQPAQQAPVAPASRGQHRHYAKTRWARRVDFKAMDRWSEDVIADGLRALGKIANQSWDDLLAQVVRDQLGTRAAPAAAIENFSLPRKRRGDFRAGLKVVLREAWARSREQAQAELPDKAELARFAAAIPQAGFDETSADKFFGAKTWQATQSFYERLEGRARETMFNGVKYDKSTREVVEALREQMDDLIPKIDAAGHAVNESAYLNTLVRTLTWEAVNESRHALFTDPSLEGFVEALEYSAILDLRTTDICTELDGRVYPLNSEEWDEFRPPNHFSCRSLLVPVTIGDEWKASNPTPGGLQPQKGFY